MQLSKKIREEFVRDVLADAPKVAYTDKAADIVRKELVKLRKAAGLADVPNERLEFRSVSIGFWKDKSTKTYSVQQPHTAWADRQEVPFVSQGQYGVTHEECKAVAKNAEVLALRDTHITQLNERAELGKRIRAVIDGCNTLKQALEVLPEFAKYLPKETPKIDRTLPVAGNVVAELVAKGWPKK